MSRILIAYYSHSSNTEKIAKIIQRKTQGTLINIRPVKPYPIDYNTVVAQAKKEIKAGFMPETEAVNINISDYDTILIGTPNWWSTVAPPIKTFLTNTNLSGKNVAVFCTHGGGGLSNIQKDVEKLCPNSDVKSSLALYNDGGSKAESAVDEWLKKAGI